MTKRTDHLIESLAAELSPIRPHAVERRLIGALLFGMLVATAALAATLGIRPDLSLALRGSVFWMKSGYVGSLAVLAAAATIRLARPDTTTPRWLWLAAAPVLMVAALAVAELARTPPTARLDIWLGASWKICPFLVLGLSVPIFFALRKGLAKLAPTRLRAVGALAGITAGASAALVYCLHCPESTASFVITWYSGGIALAGLIGAMLGPRLFRW
jgi:hypothetical protein